MVTLFYVDDNGSYKKIGDDNGMEYNPVRDRANISMNINKTRLTFKKLQYNDKFDFVCQAKGANKRFWAPETISVRMAVQNIQGTL